MTHDRRDRPAPEGTRKDDELSSEELGKVTGGSIPLRPPKKPSPDPAGGGVSGGGSGRPLDAARDGKISRPKQHPDDYIKPF